MVLVAITLIVRENFPIQPFAFGKIPDNKSSKKNKGTFKNGAKFPIGKAGYTNYEYFAYENNISRPQYGKYEAGANIQLNTLMKILKALNVSLEEFFKGFDA